MSKNDILILRDLVKQYAEIAADPINAERKELWRQHNSLKPTRVPVLMRFGPWNQWVKEMFADDQLSCEDPFYRGHEKNLRLMILHASFQDDCVFDPWLTVRAHVSPDSNHIWGVSWHNIESEMDGGAWKFNPPLQNWEDFAKLTKPHHQIDEAATKQDLGKLQDAVGDIMEIHVDRAPTTLNFQADIANNITYLRGLEQLMIDIYESPEELHKLLAFMRDGILACQEEAEDAGDFSLPNHNNQEVPICDELEDARPHSHGVKRSQLWCMLAAQEYTLISPAMHDEFLLQYQIPIMEKFGLTAYGCCEDLTEKIGMLRQVKNLRVIGVTPLANVAKCAEQMGTDYVMSWRPNPTDMVCGSFDKDNIRRIIKGGLEVSKGCYRHVFLKDIETVEGDTNRLAEWVRIVRETAAPFA